MNNKLTGYVEIKDLQLKSIIPDMVSTYEAFKACYSYANAPIQKHLCEEALPQMKIFYKIFIANLSSLLRLRKKMELMINTIEENM